MLQNKIVYVGPYVIPTKIPGQRYPKCAKRVLFKVNSKLRSFNYPQSYIYSALLEKPEERLRKKLQPTSTLQKTDFC